MIWTPDKTLWLPNRFSPGCNCCGSGADDCVICNSGTTPANVIVTVPALTNGTCSNCVSVGGNYNLPQNPYSACHYFLQPTTPCDHGTYATNMNVYIYSDRVEFSLSWGGSSGQVLQWRQTHSGTINCDFSSYSLPFYTTWGTPVYCTTSDPVYLTAA